MIELEFEEEDIKEIISKHTGIPVELINIDEYYEDEIVELILDLIL